MNFLSHFDDTSLCLALSDFFFDFLLLFFGVFVPFLLSFSMRVLLLIFTYNNMWSHVNCNILLPDMHMWITCVCELDILHDKFIYCQCCCWSYSFFCPFCLHKLFAFFSLSVDSTQRFTQLLLIDR